MLDGVHDVGAERAAVEVGHAPAADLGVGARELRVAEDRADRGQAAHRAGRTGWSRRTGRTSRRSPAPARGRSRRRGIPGWATRSAGRSTCARLSVPHRSSAFCQVIKLPGHPDRQAARHRDGKGERLARRRVDEQVRGRQPRRGLPAVDGQRRDACARCSRRDNPPPPSPATNGSATPSVAATATAASIALPPWRSTSSPADVAGDVIGRHGSARPDRDRLLGQWIGADAGPGGRWPGRRGRDRRARADENGGGDRRRRSMRLCVNSLRIPPDGAGLPRDHDAAGEPIQAKPGLNSAVAVRINQVRTPWYRLA